MGERYFTCKFNRPGQSTDKGPVRAISFWPCHWIPIAVPFSLPTWQHSQSPNNLWWTAGEICLTNHVRIRLTIYNCQCHLVLSLYQTAEHSCKKVSRQGGLTSPTFRLIASLYKCHADWISIYNLEQSWPVRCCHWEVVLYCKSKIILLQTARLMCWAVSLDVFL